MGTLFYVKNVDWPPRIGSLIIFTADHPHARRNSDGKWRTIFVE